MANIIIYTTDYCPYCVKAKILLQKKKVEFKEIKISDDQTREAMIKKSNGKRTVPQIFINDFHVGGSDELHDLDRAGKLDALLK
ncbi:MAG: glutaredoxin 3 [Rickettsiales bacterium]|jgi:glutaredoxin 3